MSIDKINVITSSSQTNYLEANDNNKLKESLPTYDEIINSSEFNDILRDNRYARLQYLVPYISYRNEHPPIFTTVRYQDTESVCEEDKNKRIKSKLFVISIFLIIMIPAVFILVVIVTNVSVT